MFQQQNSKWQFSTRYVQVQAGSLFSKNIGQYAAQQNTSVQQSILLMGPAERISHLTIRPINCNSCAQRINILHRTPSLTIEYIHSLLEKSMTTKL